jgi:protein-tyrosine phosphatase
MTRWGRVFRTDSLHELTVEDLQRLDRLGVAVICDLRSPGEVDERPGPRPYVHIELRSRRVADIDPAVVRSRADGQRWLYEDYRAMLDTGATTFARIFAELASTAGRPAVFHCWGGKDRTGLTATLLLTALGVNRDVVLDDNELTSQYRGVEHTPEVLDLFVSLGMTRAAAEGLLSTPRWAMAGVLDRLDTVYGGIENYLARQARMSVEQLARLRAELTL